MGIFANWEEYFPRSRDRRTLFDWQWLIQIITILPLKPYVSIFYSYSLFFFTNYVLPMTKYQLCQTINVAVLKSLSYNCFMDYTFWRVLSQPKWLDKSKSKVVVWINTEFNSNFHFHFSDFVNVESIQYIEQYEYLYHNYGSTRANGFWLINNYYTILHGI